MAVAEPLAFRREAFGQKYIWGNSLPQNHQQFNDWQNFLNYEQKRRERAKVGSTDTEAGVDAALICTLDTQHVEIILALAPLGLHMLSEKPLATTLQDCISIHRSLKPPGRDAPPTQLFGVGHVLRYSPHNMLLRKLLLQDRVIGDVLSVEHTEPVGWQHFSHSYVRGNWRREGTTAPSLLTKSCHDIDLILWLLCCPADPESHDLPHSPASITSTGHRGYFKKTRKPKEAGSATNCLTCPIEDGCRYSAKKIYLEQQLMRGNTDWPVNVVVPDIEDTSSSKSTKLLERLSEDYDTQSVSDNIIKARPWFGRCVWESDNDVCDDQVVNIAWEDDNMVNTSRGPKNCAKTATFHQIAHTEAQCARRGRVYGSHGELSYDSKTIRVFDFGSQTAKEYHPTQLDFNDPIAKHGGGDTGLVRQFIGAVAAVKKKELNVDQAQKRFLGCTVEDVLRSHALVFAAEEARISKTVIDWKTWWKNKVVFFPENASSNALNGGYEVIGD